MLYFTILLWYYIRAHNFCSVSKYSGYFFFFYCLMWCLCSSSNLSALLFWLPMKIPSRKSGLKTFISGCKPKWECWRPCTCFLVARDYLFLFSLLLSGVFCRHPRAAASYFFFPILLDSKRGRGTSEWWLPRIIFSLFETPMLSDINGLSDLFSSHLDKALYLTISWAATAFPSVTVFCKLSTNCPHIIWENMHVALDSTVFKDVLSSGIFTVGRYYFNIKRIIIKMKGILTRYSKNLGQLSYI